MTDGSSFPGIRYYNASGYFNDYGEEIVKAWWTVSRTAIHSAAEILLEAYTTGARVFSCGNGGSASISNHLQCDHLKGIRRGTSLVPRVISLSSNIELITGIANDMSYSDVFTYQLQSHASPGDVLIVISSSGRSANVCGTIRWARDNGLRTIAITGFDGGVVRELAEVAIHVDCDNYGIVEDVHQAVMHALAQYIRQSQIDPADIAETVF